MRLTLFDRGEGLMIEGIFAWFDLWVGVFIDRPGRRVFVFPVPMFGIVIDWSGER